MSSKENLRKRITEIRDFLSVENHKTQDFILLRKAEKESVRNLEKILVSKFGTQGMGLAIATATTYLLEEIEKEEKDNTKGNE